MNMGDIGCDGDNNDDNNWGLDPGRAVRQQVTDNTFSYILFWML